VKHELRNEGLAYSLRPVRLSDAQFIIDLRLEDKVRNQFIHTISPVLKLQQEWLAEYFKRGGDYYFVVENKLTGEPEGLIGIYDVENGKAEWGRWVTKKGSLAATESLQLLFEVAFDTLNLDELYCRTLSENKAVVALHDSLPQLRRGVCEKLVALNGQHYDAIEHYTTPEHYETEIQAGLETKAVLIFKRNLRALIGNLDFHHIGVATKSIKEELNTYRFLGYTREGPAFEDAEQGIIGQFIVAPGQPRLELLENLKGSSTLDTWLDHQIKMYHFAYKTPNIEAAIKQLNQNKIRLVSPLKISSYFRKRICFLMLSPRFLIELIEE